MYIMPSISYISIPTEEKTIYFDLMTGEILENDKLIFNVFEKNTEKKKTNTILSQFLRYFRK